MSKFKQRIIWPKIGIDTADAATRRGLRAKNSWKISIKKATVWLEAEHPFLLTREGTKITLGNKITMTGREAKERNAVLENKFKRQLDEGKNTNLWRWQAQDWPEGSVRMSCKPLYDDRRK